MSQAKSHINWKSLYRVGATAALIIVVLYVIEIIAFFAVPVPGTVNDWFTLLHNNRLLGLLQERVLDVVAVALLGPLYLALYVALRRANETYMAVATILFFVGMAVYIATDMAFSMLYLSDQYAAATTDAQRAQFLAAGQGMLAVGHGTGLYMAFILMAVAGLIVSTVMLRSKIFGKVIAYVGILANALQLADFVRLAFVPALGAILIVIAGVLSLIWYILVARRLFMLAQGISKEEGNHPALA
jgi:Domain of unknown function (DUF4386)